MKRALLLLNFVIVTALLLAACSPAAPQTPIEVQVTQIVKQTEIVAGTPVVKEVVVTSTPAPTENPYDDQAKITVYLDNARMPMYEAYAKAFPDKAKLIDAVPFDRNQFMTKLVLWNNIDKGWPDVMFMEVETVIRSAAANNLVFPMDLNEMVANGWLSKDVIDNYTPGTLDACTVDGHLYCLRHDVAPIVMFYDKPLMDKFGYQVPTTMAEYQALGEKLVVEHPGYVMDSVGWTELMHNTFFWSSGCPSVKLVGNNQVSINTTDPKCTRAAEFVRNGLEKGYFVNYAPWAPEYVKLVQEQKVLVQFQAAWAGRAFYGGNKDSMWYPEKTSNLGVALMPKWDSAEKNSTGAEGGSGWVISRHTKNPKLALDFITWVATSPNSMKLESSFPAYQPANDLWGKDESANTLYAFDPMAVFTEAAGLIEMSNYAYTRIPRSEAVDATLANADSGIYKTANSIPDILTAWGEYLVKIAEPAGYEVVK